eukprot:scaffold271571_cov20-Prasinocladus_malaysianus.AAC.1
MNKQLVVHCDAAASQVIIDAAVQLCSILCYVLRLYIYDDPAAPLNWCIDRCLRLLLAGLHSVAED